MKTFAQGSKTGAVRLSSLRSAQRSPPRSRPELDQERENRPPPVVEGPGFHFSEISILSRAPRPVVQAKLTVGAPDDQFEKEAEQMAERVMRLPPSPVAPEPSTPPDGRGPRIGDVGHVQRLCSECEDEKIQRKAGDREEEGGSEARSIIGDDIASRIHDIHTGGEPLSEQNRSFFEPRFGHSFSKVRIHADRAAAETAQSLRARAYTLGSDIVFGAGQYSPETAEGRRLLAHELTHVVQQGQAGPASTDSQPAAVMQREPAGGEPVIQRQKTSFGPTQGAPPDWDKQVKAATSSADRAALIKKATGLTVNDATSASATDTSPTAAHLTEYTNAGQTINYDDSLNSKTSPVDGRPLDRNAGYTLQPSGKDYIVLGPKALDPDRYFETMTVLSHEFDHVRQRLAGSALKGNESELDAWTSSFVRDFHRTYLLGDTGSTCYVQSVAMFTPLLGYYSHAKVSQTQRDAAAKRIEDYYNTTVKVHAGHTAAFRFWVHRSIKSVSVTPNLADRLNTDLSLGINASDSLGATRQFPCGTLKTLTYPAPTLDKATLPAPTPAPTPTPSPKTKP